MFILLSIILTFDRCHAPGTTSQGPGVDPDLPDPDPGHGTGDGTVTKKQGLREVNTENAQTGMSIFFLY